MIEVLKKYPKATEVVRKHYKNLLLQNFKGELDGPVKEYFDSQVLSDEEVAKLLEVNPFHIAHLFDEYGVHIYIFPTPDPNEKKEIKIVFGSHINVPPHGVLLVNNFKTRKEAEKEAVIKAFEVLNDKL